MPLAPRVIAMAVGLCCASAPSGANADPHAGVDAQLYRLSLDSLGILSLEGAETLPRYDISLKLGFGYASSPLSLAVPGIGGAFDANSDVILSDVATFAMAFAIGLAPRLSLAIEAGAFRTDPGAGYGQIGRFSGGVVESNTGLISLRPRSNITPVAGGALTAGDGRSGPTDARIALKAHLIADESLNLALAVAASVPFGDEEMFLGEENFVFEPRLALGLRIGDRARLLANIGARIRQRTVLQAFDPVFAGEMPEDAAAVFDLGSEVLGAIGAEIELHSVLSAAADITVFLPLPAGLSIGSCHLHDGQRCSSLDSSPGNANYFADADYGDPAAYLLGGLAYRFTPDTTVHVAVGAGIAGHRSDSFRVVTTLSWQPSPVGTRTLDRDADGDGVPTISDLCPDQPEDRDGFEDFDGCPDLDNDGDGLIDTLDSCPNDAEDQDGFEDFDGCPEPDNDGDGVPDLVDQCPNAKEDFDGFDDDDGCPDTDNDGDGIEDAQDKCPNEPETVNGFEDTDGCPDSRASAGPQLGIDRIELGNNSVDFVSEASAQLTNASKVVLAQVARVISSQDVVIRVEVHVPLSTKSKKRSQIRRAKRSDKRFANKRARAVIAELVSRGVASNKLIARGIGSAKPASKPAHLPTNARVVFVREGVPK